MLHLPFLGRPKLRVLALGDSHVRVFEHWYFRLAMPRTRFDVVYLPGATASGIRNARSATQSGRVFKQALAASDADVVLVHLGEVDTAYTIWKRAERLGRRPRSLLRDTVDRYWEFLLEIAATRRLVVIGACLPTLANQAEPGDEVATTRSEISASQHERTALARLFNARLARRCARLGIPFWDSATVALGADGLVRPEWTHPRRRDHHYARLPFARWLAGQLKSLQRSGGITAPRQRGDRGRA